VVVYYSQWGRIKAPMNTFWCQISYQMVNVRGLIDDIAQHLNQQMSKDDDQQNKSLFRQSGSKNEKS